MEQKRKIMIIYRFECGSILKQVVMSDGSDTTIDAMVDNGDFIDFQFPSDIISCDWIVVD